MKMNFCVACGSWDSVKLEHHHLVPKTEGGTDDQTNLITLCPDCHGKIHGVLRRSARELTSKGLQEKKRRRERLGTTPLGYKTIEGADGQKLVVEDAGEMETVRLIRQWHSENIGLREIARRLTAAGHKTKRGGAWEPITVSRLLKKRYIEEIKNAAP